MLWDDEETFDPTSQDWNWKKKTIKHDCMPLIMFEAYKIIISYKP